MDLKKLEQQYKNELLDNIIPFWLDKSQDEEYG
jgi:N-acylglucosamine 2-epimerase